MAYVFNVSSGMANIADLTVGTLRGCVGIITNAMIDAAAAISSSKLVNRHVCVYQQQDGAAVADTTGDGVPIYVCDKTNGATVKKVTALCQDVGSGGAPAYNIEIDVQKYDISGTALASVLTAAFDITESESDYEMVNGTLDSAEVALDAGDSLVVSITYTGASGTDMQGVIVQVEVDEEGS